MNGLVEFDGLFGLDRLDDMDELDGLNDMNKLDGLVALEGLVGLGGLVVLEGLVGLDDGRAIFLMLELRSLQCAVSRIFIPGSNSTFYTLYESIQGTVQWLNFTIYQK